MQHALNQADILSLIVQNLRDSYDALATLARTSRLISTIALDELWRSVNIIVLARCMPSKHWEEVETYTPFEGPRFCGNSPPGRYDSYLTLTAQDRRGDWLGPRFRKYAARIRRLDTKDRVVDRDEFPICPAEWVPPVLEASSRSHRLPFMRLYTDYVTSSLAPDVLSAWQACSYSDGLLFPNLRDLIWEPHNAHLLNYVDMLCPVLFKLTLDPSQITQGRKVPSDDPSQAATTMIQHVVRRCPSLRSLDLSSPYVMTPIFDSLIVAPLERLKTFRCFKAVPRQVVQQLSKLPNLQVLDISFEQTSSKLTINRTCASFIALRWLCMKDINPIDARTLISALESDRLQYLELTKTSHNSSVHDLQELLHQIADCRSASSIQHLRISYRLQQTTSSPSVSQSEIDAANEIRLDLSPVFTLKNLQHLRLDSLGSHVGTCLVVNLHVWPYLETLITDASSNPQIPLETFYEMICGHPSLETLTGIQLKCSLGQDLSVSPPGPLPQLLKTGIHVYSAEDDTVERAPLVHYLINMFPDLINNHWDRSTIYGDERAKAIVSGAIYKMRSNLQWTVDQYREYERSLVESLAHESKGNGRRARRRQ